jgi:bifunctional enzyme CysN/CysC
MAHASSLIATDIQAYLHAHQHKGLLRFITCGSVDDGKSTLIGRLLYESRLLFDDHLAALQADSRKWGTQGEALDFALLVDGLAAEREQGITIDVAYRFFSTDRRKFIVADTPGHEQYTRNMVTGASTADAAVLMVDARKGVLTQTRRHSTLVHLLGIRHVLVAINKMDLVDYARGVHDRIVEDYGSFARTLAGALGAQGLGFETITFVPMSAFKGDNVTTPSAAMPWYQGPTLMGWLETVAVDRALARSGPLRFPVQWVNRPDLDFRGFAGTLAGGCVTVGERIRVQPSGRESTVTRIVTHAGDRPSAWAGDAVTLVLADQVDVSRGDMISCATAPAEVADQFECTLVWMDDEPLLPGRPYWLKIGTNTVTATVTDIRHQLNVNTLEHVAARRLELNAIAVCKLSLDRPVPFDAYAANRDTGGFILIDRMSHRTAGAGMLHFALRRAHNIHPQALDVDKAARAALKGQKPCVVWFTGLSGSGKSTIANALEKRLHAMGRHTYLLDGDNVRHGLNRDLGFTPEDRVENIRRIAEVARLMADAGLIVMAAFISPYRAERDMARSLLPEGEFIEVFVDTPLEVAESRDPKGLYRKARRGELKNFTGIDAPYEVPEQPELRLNTATGTPDEAAQRIVAWLEERGMLGGAG